MSVVREAILWEREVSRETLVLAALCMLDLVVTVALVASQQAFEANAFLGYFLERSIVAFCAVKTVFVVSPLLLAEWYRPFNDRLIRNTLRLVIAAYVVIWSIGFLRANPLLFY